MEDPLAAGTIVGRYAVYGEIASGGMATVHYGRLLGPAGFSRTVAIKRLHPQFAKDPEFCSMLLDEARLAARISHPNVVATIDVVARAGELFLVMDDVQGEALSKLFRTLSAQGARIPKPIAIGIAVGVLYGLHAAHEAKTSRGEPLDIVHRDVSPQNILVGTDGVSRVLDFGVAKAAGRIQMTREGQIKGKVAYMSPEQLTGQPVDRRTDIYAAAVVFWEALAGKRLFDADHAAVMSHLGNKPIPPPSESAPDIGRDIDAIVLRGLARDREARFATAREMAMALEATGEIATAREIGEWVQQLATATLRKRATQVEEIERVSAVTASVVQVPKPAAMAGESLLADAAPVSVAPPASSKPMPADASRAEATPLRPSDATSEPIELSSGRGRPRSFVGVAAVGSLVVAGLLTALAYGRRETAAEPNALLENAAPSALVSASASASASEPSASQAPPSVSATAPPEPPAPEATSAPHRVGKPPVAPPHKPPPKSGCTPPYTITADGVRQYKPECLK